MDLNNQKLLKGEYNNGEADDRITKLPDSLLHYILSFVETKCVARTSVLSKRWYHIWTSIPTLDFPFWDFCEDPSSLWEINNFMDFVDRTLHLHDANIQKFSLNWNDHLNASRVHSWIENVRKRNVEELNLYLSQDEPFSIPLSLFTCASLTKLELSVFPSIHFPRNISLPKLKSITLCAVQFTDGLWNEQLFSNSPVLEELFLENCTWFGVRSFCLLTPALKVLQIQNVVLKEDGLQDCDFKIHAPSLVSLTYWGCVAKDYDLSSFLPLDKAEVDFSEYQLRREQSISHGAAVSKFLRAVSHARCLSIFVPQVLSAASDFVNNLPAFHKLNELYLLNGRTATTDKLIFALLKAAPNLKRLLFEEFVLSSSDDGKGIAETEDLFRHLQTVWFRDFIGDARELRWAGLILKNAKSLQTMSITYGTGYSNAKSKEALMLELPSLPRASGSGF